MGNFYSLGGIAALGRMEKQGRLEGLTGRLKDPGYAETVTVQFKPARAAVYP